MATQLIQNSKPGTSRSMKGRSMFPAFLENEVAVEDLFPELHEEECRINGGCRSKCGSWLVRNDGDVDLEDAFESRFLGVLLPTDVIEMMGAESDGPDQYSPELILEWHQEYHQEQSDPGCVFCQDRQEVGLQDEAECSGCDCPFCTRSEELEEDEPEQFCTDQERLLIFIERILRGAYGDHEFSLNDAEEELLEQTTDETSTLKTEPLWMSGSTANSLGGKRPPRQSKWNDGRSGTRRLRHKERRLTEFAKLNHHLFFEQIEEFVSLLENLEHHIHDVFAVYDHRSNEFFLSQEEKTLDDRSMELFSQIFLMLDENEKIN